MRKEHLTFEQLSDLLDDAIPTHEECESFLDHIQDCPYCAGEYKQLQNMQVYFRHMRSQEFELGNLAGSTFDRYNSQKRTAFRKKMVSFSAAAAAVAIFSVTSLYTLKNQTSTNAIAKKSTGGSTIAGDSETVISLVRDSKGRVLRMTDSYVEAEVPRELFKRLRRQLGFRKVVFVRQPGAIVAKKKNWRKGIETVGAGAASVPREKSTSFNKGFVRFRVLR